MKSNFFSHIRHFVVWIFKYLLYLCNLILLACLGIKTAKLWISRPFDFADTLEAFPEEPEFINKAYAEKQFWFALGFETVLFIIGGYLCYELLIKQKTFKRSFTAVLIVVFMWTSGESIFLFLPATEKAQAISACQALNISWDKKKHKCRLMDLELKRFEKLKALKKKRRSPVGAKKANSVKKTAPASKKETNVPSVTAKKTPPSPQATKNEKKQTAKKNITPNPLKKKQPIKTPTTPEKNLVNKTKN